MTFEAIYARHAAEVHRAAYAILRDAALAEDVVQEVFERLWRGSGHDERRGPLGAYLRLLARSRALDLWRRTRTGERMQQRLEEQAGPAPVASQRPRPRSPAPRSGGSRVQPCAACRTPSVRPSASPFGVACRRTSWPLPRGFPSARRRAASGWGSRSCHATPHW